MTRTSKDSRQTGLTHQLVSQTAVTRWNCRPCPRSLLHPSPHFGCFVEIKTELGDPDTDKMSCYIMLASYGCHSVRDQTMSCPPFVCQVLAPTVWHWATEYTSSGLFSLHILPLGFDVWGGEASCLTFTAFWLTFTRHRRVQTEGDGYRNATRHQHFCQYGSGRNFRASTSGQPEGKGQEESLTTDAHRTAGSSFACFTCVQHRCTKSCLIKEIRFYFRKKS